MRNMIISCIVFILMFIVLFFASSYIVLTCDKLLDVCAEVEEKIVDEQWEEGYMISFELLNIYEGHISNLTLFLNHNDFDNVYENIVELTQFVKCETKNEALASIHVIKTLINQVREMEEVSISNIF